MVNVAFKVAQAVVVLFTPDDEARLHPDLHGQHEPDHEVQLTGQARPNVLIEAGMSLIGRPDETIIVEIGSLRPITNLGGRNVVRITADNVPRALNEIAERLESAAHCPVDRSSARWLNVDRFRTLKALTRRPRREVETASTGSTAPSTPSADAQQIVQELNAHVEIAATDLLDTDDEITAEQVRHWTGTTEESIRNRCGAPYASVFRAKGRGLPPSDELNTKIAYILDDLIFKARSGHFS